jgi:L-threonylcarbamoyladenylate synthase
METVIRTVDRDHLDPEIIQEAAALIRRGELVAFPTETVYGLGADALLPEGARRIYAAKGRPSDNPLIVHICEFEALKKIAADLPPEAALLAEAFWPGPLTMIFCKSECVPYETTGGMDTVAVRMPSHPVAAALIRESGGYIAAPSANTSGRPSPTLAEHVYEDLQGRIPLILDGGAVGIGLESTIVDLSEEVPMILRPGYITKEMLEQVIGTVRNDPGFIGSDSKIRPKAPGMKYRHYAPKARMVLVSGPVDLAADKIRELAEKSCRKGERCGILCTDETKDLYEKMDQAVIKSIGQRQNEETIAHNLYGILREFDQADVDCIYSESFPEDGIGAAIMNRMLKAAGHQVIHV